MLLTGGPTKTFWKRCHSELVPEGSSRLREGSLEHSQLWLAERTGGRRRGTCTMTSDSVASCMKGGRWPIETEREIDRS